MRGLCPLATSTLALGACLLVASVGPRDAPARLRAELGADDAPADDATIARTSCGVARGVRVANGSAVEWRGLPYAAPPVGARRWRAPEPAACPWAADGPDGVTDAREYGLPCAQRNPITGDFEGAEDCLRVHVTAPADWRARAAREGPLPVLFWIHGGSLVQWSAATRAYRVAPAGVADDGVVVVSVEYRLNAFGWLATRALRAEAEGAGGGPYGNWGLLDQIVALEWVRAHAASFGGDARRVTLLGQSSGGTSILALLAAPAARGLFRAAIALSASCEWAGLDADAALAANEVWNRKCEAATGCDADDLACLRLVDARAIVAECNPYAEWPQWGDSALLTLPWRTRHNASVGPVVFADGVVLPLGGPIAAARRGRGGMPSAVPLILATMAQETDFAVEDLAPGADRAELAGLVRARFGTFDASGALARRALALYPSDDARARDATRAYTSMGADVGETCACDALAAALAAADAYDAPVWRLVTTATLSHGTHFMGHEQHFAFHALDLYAGLARFEWNPEFGGPPYAPSADDDALGAGLRAIHLELARDGALANATRFPPFGGAPGVPEGQRVLVEHRGATRAVPTYHEEQCRLFEEYGVVPAYSWRN